MELGGRTAHAALGALTIASCLGGWWAFGHVTDHYTKGAYVHVTVPTEPTTLGTSPTTEATVPVTATEHVSVPVSGSDSTGVVSAWGSMLGGVAGVGGLVVSVRRRPSK